MNPACDHCIYHLAEGWGCPGEDGCEEAPTLVQLPFPFPRKAGPSSKTLEAHIEQLF